MYCWHKWKISVRKYNGYKIRECKKCHKIQEYELIGMTSPGDGHWINVVEK